MFNRIYFPSYQERKRLFILTNIFQLKKNKFIVDYYLLPYGL